MDSEELTLSFLATDGISGVLRQIGSTVEGLAGKVLNAFGGMGGAAGPLAAGIGKIGESLTVVGGIATGIFALADHLASSTAKYSLEVERNSATLGVNTDLMQTLYQAGAQVGAGQETINRSLFFFNANLESGGRTLKSYGLSLKELGITSRDTNEAFLQASDAVHNAATAEERGAIAKALFSRAAVQLLPVLEEGRAGIARLTQEYTDMGLVLTDGQLKISALAGVIHEKLQLQLKGLEQQVGVRLESAFLVLWNVMGQVLGKGKGLVDALSGAIANAVIWIAAFIAALTGTTVKLSDFTSALNDESAKLALAGGATNDATDATQKLGDSYKATEQALQDQISALQDQQSAYDDASAAQVGAVNAEADAYNTLVDAQRASLQEEMKKLDLARQQADAQQGVADIQRRIAQDQTDLARAPYLGVTDYSSLNDRLRSDQQALAKALDRIAFDSTKNQLQDKISALDAQKKARNDAFQDQIKAFDAERKAHDDLIKDEIKGLEERLKQVQRAAAASTAASAASNSAIVGGAAAATGQIGSFYDKLKNDLAASFGSMSSSGAGAFQSIRDSVTSVMDALYGPQSRGQGGRLTRDSGGGLIGGLNVMLGLLRDVAGAARGVASAFQGIQAFTGAGGTSGHPERRGDLNPIDVIRNVVLDDLGAINSLLEAPASWFGAEGAIVTQPTLALIGEAGPEVLRPLSSAPGASALPGSGGSSDESIALLRVIAGALTRPSGSGTGIEAKVQSLVDAVSYQRSRGVYGY